MFLGREADNKSLMPAFVLGDHHSRTEIVKPVFLFQFQFSGKHFAGLKDLADAVDIDAGAEWELRLYSFDSR